LQGGTISGVFAVGDGYRLGREVQKKKCETASRDLEGTRVMHGDPIIILCYIPSDELVTRLLINFSDKTAFPPIPIFGFFCPEVIRLD